MLKILTLNIILLLHPIHLSLTTINKPQDSDTLKVTFRMYVDDFHLDYAQYYPDFKPGSTGDTTDYNREMLGRYFNDKVRIYINNRLLTGNLTDVSVNSYEILLTLIYQSYKKPRIMKVSNKVLTGIYGDQANMVYLNINEYEDALKLTVEEPEGTVKLK